MNGRKRVSQVELAYKARFVKTFENERYELKGSIAVERNSGEIAQVADIYYRVRSAQNKNKKLIAKRKNRSDELCLYLP
ncbi:hypothetical protein [Alteribacillus bidgolensis]|uniref:Uncharacterized protein n=1 Tax=Alteribacillus bidgolensis TaxID=930129 RepID=A0A1G8Q524_9BACI|nr:hypothetical protein [Alteribacillus bidgolensis]SDI99859.1 hypothetical protein SAMN05216352_1183 [Alteribacillus bidgolensis]